MCTKNGNQGQESRGQGSQGKMVALYNFSPSSCTYAADCVHMYIISIFSIFAVLIMMSYYVMFVHMHNRDF